MVRLRMIRAGEIVAEQEWHGALPARGDEVLVPDTSEVAKVTRRVWDAGTSPLKPTTVVLYLDGLRDD